MIEKDNSISPPASATADTSVMTDASVASVVSAMYGSVEGSVSSEELTDASAISVEPTLITESVSTSEPIPIEVRALGSGAQGIATRDDGKTVFVDGLLVGEKALVEIISERAHVASARVVERLNDSPDRVIPPCPYYERCGGCSCMHMNYAAQARYKENKVREDLSRIGKLSKESIQRVLMPIVDTPESNVYHYRNHMQFSISPSMRIGFKARDSHDVIEIDNCLLESPTIALIRGVVQEVLIDYPTTLWNLVIIRGSERTGEFIVEFVCDNNSAHMSHEIIMRDASYYVELTHLEDRISKAIGDSKLMGIVLQICSDKTSRRYRSGKRVVMAGVDYYHEMLLDRKFRVKSGAFFQVNTLQAERLFEIVRSGSENSSSILDLFCGTGTIGLTVVNDNQRLLGIESSPEAVASARVNAKLSGAGATDISFVVKQAERYEFNSSMLKDVDLVIVDPPRKGLDVALITKLVKLAPSRIIYVSCDPATLSRDIKTLSGSYRIEAITPVDLFPMTGHVETVVLLSRKHIDK